MTELIVDNFAGGIPAALVRANLPEMCGVYNTGGKYAE